MQGSLRALLRRGGAACAVAAVVLGSTLCAGAARAESGAPPTASASASPSPGAGSAPTTPAPTGTLPASPVDVPDGLAAAVQRDLGMSAEQFNAAGTLAAEAAVERAEVVKVDPSAVVSIKDGSILVTASPAAAAAARNAAGAAKVTAATPAPTVTRAKGVEELFQAYAAEFGIGNLQSIMVNAAGTYVIRTGEPADGPTPHAPAPAKSVRDFAADYGNVAVERAEGPAAAHGDVVNGQGYVSELAGGSYEACTVGWNAFSKKGQPAAISAGHCTQDGTQGATFLTDPAVDEAGGGVVRIGTLGTFGFSQFGGPNNSSVTGTSFEDIGNVGTDIAVIDGIGAAWNQLPIVTNWSMPHNLAAGAAKVTAVAEAIIGTPVCKSGRTTGWSCQTVTETGVFIVQGTNFSNNPGDLRAVRGFGSLGLTVGPGDSGGPVIAGTTAVGIISAGGTFQDGPNAGKFIAYAAGLQDALSYTDGYTIKIFVNAPALAKPANEGKVKPGATITGTVKNAPAGTVVTVALDGRTSTAAVNAQGIWTVKAPHKVGSFTVKTQARNGFSTSATATFTVTVARQRLPAPAVAGPHANANPAAPVRALTDTALTETALTETGTPDATEALALARTGTPAGLAPLGVAGGLLVLGGAGVVLLRHRLRD